MSKVRSVGKCGLLSNFNRSTGSFNKIDNMRCPSTFYHEGSLPKCSVSLWNPPKHTPTVLSVTAPSSGSDDRHLLHMFEADRLNAGSKRRELQLNIRAGVWALHHCADTTGRSVQPCAGVVNATDKLRILSVTVAGSPRGTALWGWRFGGRPRPSASSGADVSVGHGVTESTNCNLRRKISTPFSDTQRWKINACHDIFLWTAKVSV